MANQYDQQPIEYDMSDLERHSTYDQFLSLRDTLVLSGKKYAGKAGSKLIIGEKEKTVEVVWNNLYKTSFDNNRQQSPENIRRNIFGPYVKFHRETADIYGELSGVIQQDGRYRIIHKEEILLKSTTNKICCYVDVIRGGVGGYTPKGGVAVFDWECNSTTLSGTDSMGGSCNVSFTFGKLFKKITAFGYIETNLKKDDILVLRMRDKGIDADGNPQGNILKVQDYSNFLSIEYLDLPFKIN